MASKMWMRNACYGGDGGVSFGLYENLSEWEEMGREAYFSYKVVNGFEIPIPHSGGSQ